MTRKAPESIESELARGSARIQHCFADSSAPGIDCETACALLGLRDAALRQCSVVLEQPELNNDAKREIARLVRLANAAMNEFAMWLICTAPELIEPFASNARELIDKAHELIDELSRHGAGPRLKHERVARRHRAMDEGWNAGYQTEKDLFDFMKDNYSDLITTRTRLIGSRHMWAEYMKYRHAYGRESV